MVITSTGFLLIFLPITLLLYWRTPHKLLILGGVSLLFYALGSLIFLPLLLGLSLLTYQLARWWRTGIGIALNLAALILFKYLNFGLESLNQVTQTLGIPLLLPLLELALPLGISFFVFKHIGYLLDIRANRYPAVTNRLLFVTYSAFFSQISAGPMSISDDTLRQLANLPDRIDAQQAVQGILSISIGLMKKILIADQLNQALQAGLFSADASGLIWAWSSVGMFALQLYFDFSAYTDMALGVGMLFGIRLPANFNNPYLATTPTDFWQRWHMSLSMWFRVYLFSPLSRSLLQRWGTIRAPAAQYAANFVTMGLVGLWHGAGWGFVLWGLYHGLLLNAYAWGKRRRIVLENRFVLVFLVLIGWALFLSPDLNFAARLFANLFGASGIGAFTYAPAALLTATAALVLTLAGMVEAANMPDLKRPAYAFALGVLAVLCLMHLGSAAQFIYVQF
jgi:alginate O-acetyltransferase complex protein AlgI